MSHDTTEPQDGGIPFPAINESVVGTALVRTARATELHRSLKVGRDFSNWIKGRLKRYGFVENVDYVKEEIFGSPDLANQSGRGGDRRSIEYHLTLDTAKELAMVENNAQGRAVRRYFIACEGIAHEGGFTAEAMEMLVRTNGMARQVSGRLAKLQAVVDALATTKPIPALDFGSTVSAYQIIESAGIATADRQRGTAQMVTKRLLAFCAAHGEVCFQTPAEVNPSKPFRFTKAIAGMWLLGEARGLELIRSQVERMKARKAARGHKTGQGSLRLVQP